MLRAVSPTKMNLSLLLKCIGYTIICLLILFFVIHLDWGQVVNQVLNVGWKYWLILPINVTAYYFGTLSWKYCLGNERLGKSTWYLFKIRHIGETLAIINPTNVIAGDSAKHFLLKNKCVDKNACIASLFLSRIIIIIAAMLLGLSAFVYLLFKLPHKDLHPWVILMLISVLVVIIILIWGLITSKKLYLFKICQKLWSPFNFSGRGIIVLNRINQLNTTFASYYHNNKQALFISFSFAILHWIFGAVEFGFILSLLGLPITWMESLTLEMGVALVKSIGTIIPGQIGIEEYGTKVMLLSIGFATSTLWVSVSILRRMRQLLWLAVGMIFFVLVKKNK